MSSIQAKYETIHNWVVRLTSKLGGSMRAHLQFNQLAAMATLVTIQHSEEFALLILYFSSR